jgi:hypothetical protein
MNASPVIPPTWLIRLGRRNMQSHIHSSAVGKNAPSQEMPAVLSLEMLAPFFVEAEHDLRNRLQIPDIQNTLKKSDGLV